MAAFWMPLRTVDLTKLLDQAEQFFWIELREADTPG
jgi:hypothetical protein